MKTYAIYNDETITLVVKTSDMKDLEANKKHGKYLKEVEDGFNPFYHKVVNKELVLKAQEELMI